MTVGKTAAEFGASHDKKLIAHTKVKAALRSLTKDRWMYEGDFIKLAKLAQVQWGAVADAYIDYVVLAKRIGKGTQGNARRVICGSKKLAAKLREVTQV